MDGFGNGKFSVNKKTRHFGTCLFCFPVLGVFLAASKGVSKTDGFSKSFSPPKIRALFFHREALQGWPR